MIPEEVLRKYNMSTLEEYEERHGQSDSTTETFYQTFLSQTDYLVIRATERQESMPEGMSDYRQFAREEIERVRG